MTPAAKAVKKAVPKAMKAKPVGKITHYYDKIGVGVLKLSGILKVGDTVTFKRGEREFTQTVESMQMDHKEIRRAKKGQSIGLKIAEKIGDGAKVLRAS